MRLKTALTVLSVFGGFVLVPVSASAQNIVFTGGSADLTFFFESQAGDNGEWHVVMREKASTVASGYDSNADAFPGFFGQTGGGDDINMDSLEVVLNTTTQQTVNGNDYWISSATGSGIFGSGTADFGIRIRLREDFGGGIVEQFDTFNITLNSVTSASGGDFVLFGWDEFDTSQVADVRYETAASDMTNDWGINGHTHWHYGFTELDTYTLNFTGTGVGGLYGETAPTVDFAVDFTVVPEPATYGVLLGVAVLGGVLWMRRRRGLSLN